MNSLFGGLFTKSTRFILFLLITVFNSNGCMRMGVKSPLPTMTFIHPGALNNLADLDFVKAQIKTGAEPWTSVFKQVKVLAKGSALALTFINSRNDEEADKAKNEAQKTYANALVWYFTGQGIYGDQALAGLNAWAGFQGFNAGDDQDKLLAGWLGALLGPAAEIMSGYSRWAEKDKTRVQEMFKRAFYPQLTTPSAWNGNVDLTQIDALMNIAVFNEDEKVFKMGLDRLQKRIPAYFYLASDGAVPAIDGDGGHNDNFWSNPAQWVDGLTQETCRDNGHHAQYGMASALHAAEVAWNQGVDVYTPNTARFTAAMELLATQLLTGNMQGICGVNAATNDLYDTWEVGFNHYHNRKKIHLPNTEKLIKKQVRTRGWSDWNIFYETLTHAK
ncbi:MAG: alginate lyase family protein [Saprospiraceae bacterium]|nr:alginate lyase family protein [Saprospiraceae bacterium]